MENDSSIIAQEALFEVIENQLRDNTPPITNATYSRLKNSEGKTHEQSMKLIACALSIEFYEILKNKEIFNAERYTNNLIALPTLPWDK